MLEVASLKLLEIEKDKFAHIIRTSLRQEQWDNLRYRRPQFLGAELFGIDRDLTMHLYRSNKLTGLDRYRLRCILAGAVATQARLARNHKDAESPICPCCQLGVVETLEHLLLQCPAHSRERERDLRPEYFQALPPCTKLHGIIPLKMQFPDDVGEDRDSRVDLAYRIQYTLLGILQSREKYKPTSMAPRWTAQA